MAVLARGFYAIFCVIGIIFVLAVALVVVHVFVGCLVDSELVERGLRRSYCVAIVMIISALVASQLVQRILHLLIAVVNDLVDLIQNLIKSGSLEPQELLVMLRQYLGLLLSLIVYLKNPLQISQLITDVLCLCHTRFGSSTLRCLRMSLDVAASRRQRI